MLIFRAVFILLVLAILSIGVYMIALQSPNHKRCYKNKTERFEYVDNNNIESGIKMTQINVESMTLNDKNIFEYLYPVGYVYMSYTNTNPGKLFDFGTWEQLPVNHYLVSGDKQEIGGSNIIKESNLPSHKHTVNITSQSSGNHKHNISFNTGKDGKHTHGITKPREVNVLSGVSGAGKRYNNVSEEPGYNTATTTNEGGEHTHSVSGDTKETGAHTHLVKGETGTIGKGDEFLPTYVKCYMWRRIM